MKKTFIYCVHDPRPNSLEKYIGKSDDPKVRLNSHFYEKGKYYSANWFRKLKSLGFDLNEQLDVIDEVPENEWQFWERHYISLYRSWGFILTNTSPGGRGGFKGQHSLESKNKIGNASSKRMLNNKHASSWTELEIKLLLETYENTLYSKLKDLFPNKSYDSITMKANRLNLRKKVFENNRKNK